MLGTKQVNTIKNRLANLMEVLRSIPTSDAKKKKKKLKREITYWKLLNLFFTLINYTFFFL